jgi:hypothetical protein
MRTLVYIRGLLNYIRKPISKLFGTLNVFLFSFGRIKAIPIFLVFYSDTWLLFSIRNHEDNKAGYNIFSSNFFLF